MPVLPYSLSPNLQLVTIRMPTFQDEIRYNVATDHLDESMNGLLSISVSSGDVTLDFVDIVDLRVLRITGTPSANRIVTIPSIRKEFHIHNAISTSKLITVQISSTGAKVYPAPGEVLSVYADLINLVPSSKPSVVPYDIFFMYDPIPSSGQLLHRQHFTRAVTFREGHLFSRARVNIPGSSSNAVFSIRKNGTEFATITFAPSTNDGVFSQTGDTSFAVDDILTVLAPNPANANLAELSVVIAGETS